ncbi:unnamed protein product [Brassica rapa subsp. narinosa]
MKGMVCQAKRKGIRPAWIGDTLWKKMCAYWATDAAKKKSQTASNSRNSDRGGLGPFKHFAGQMSFLRVQQKMEAELGRPVSIGEVFLRTHTKADGTFSDLKAEQIGQAYEKKLDEKMSQVEQDVCANGGDSSHIPELSPTEMNEIFLETTTLDMRGHEYGLGSLLPLYGNKKRKGGPGTSTSSAFAQLQEQLEAAQRLFEEQAAANTRRDAETAAANARRDAETAARDADHQTQINTLKMLLTYMQGKDPSFSEFMIAASASARTTPMP